MCTPRPRIPDRTPWVASWRDQSAGRGHPIVVREPTGSPLAGALARRAVLVVGAAVAMLLSPAPAAAQWAVFDASNLARHVMNYRQLIQQVAMQRDQLRYQLENMRKLGSPNFRTISTTMATIDDLTRTGIALSYSLASIAAEFDRTFPGASLTPTLTGTMAGDIRRQNERALATIRATLAAANATAAQFATSNSNLDAIKRQVGTITSAQQAAELNSTIEIHAAQELTLLRQQLAAAANAQNVYMAAQVNRDLQAVAAQAEFRRAAAAQPIRPRDMSVRALGFVP